MPDEWISDRTAVFFVGIDEGELAAEFAGADGCVSGGVIKCLAAAAGRQLVSTTLGLRFRYLSERKGTILVLAQRYTGSST